MYYYLMVALNMMPMGFVMGSWALAGDTSPEKGWETMTKRYVRPTSEKDLMDQHREIDAQIAALRRVKKDSTVKFVEQDTNHWVDFVVDITRCGTVEEMFALVTDLKRKRDNQGFNRTMSEGKVKRLRSIGEDTLNFDMRTLRPQGRNQNRVEDIIDLIENDAP